MFTDGGFSGSPAAMKSSIIYHNTMVADVEFLEELMAQVHGCCGHCPDYILLSYDWRSSQVFCSCSLAEKGARTKYIGKAPALVSQT